MTLKLGACLKPVDSANTPCAEGRTACEQGAEGAGADGGEGNRAREARMRNMGSSISSESWKISAIRARVKNQGGHSDHERRPPLPIRVKQA